MSTTQGGAAPAGPLVTDGVKLDLTKQQYEVLKRTWLYLGELVDNAPVEGTGSAKPAPTRDDGDGKPPSGKQSDEAKEQARIEEEMRNAQACLREHGSRKIMDALWEFLAADDPDQQMLRFIRARKWNAEAAVSMLMNCVKWRLESGIREIFRKGEEGMTDVEGFLRQMQQGKAYTFGTDKGDHPIVYIHVGLHRTNDQPAKSMEDYILFQMENVRCLLSSPVDKVTLVFDMTGFGLASMDWKAILFLLKCFESFYPESLFVLLVHQAPWIFQGIWKVLAPLLDPVVRAKVNFTRTADDLCKFIDKSHLVKKLGGNCNWQWNYIPIQPGENDKHKDTAAVQTLLQRRKLLSEKYLDATRALEHDESEKIHLTRRYYSSVLRAEYFQLDPYIRGMSIYHRNGTIIGNGMFVYVYPLVGSEEASEVQVRGYETSREQCFLDAKHLHKHLTALGVKDLVPFKEDVLAS